MKTKAEKLLVENSQLRAQLSEARQKLESEVGRRECAHARPLHKNDSNVLSARARKWLAHRSVKFVPSMTFYLANRYHYSCFVSGIRWILPRKFLAKGASIYYVRKIFWILDPLPPLFAISRNLSVLSSAFVPTPPPPSVRTS